MGTIKTTNIEPIADNGTVTLGSSGDTFTLGSGVVQSNLNYPAFEAYLSANQTPSNATYTKIEFDTEVFDTDNAYDNSTNYRFTPQVGGKYFVTAHIQTEVSDDSLIDSIIRIYKNGSAYRRARDNPRNSGGERQVILHTTAIIDMNGSSDYLEIFGYVNVSASTGIFTSEEKGTYFSAYRIGS